MFVCPVPKISQVMMKRRRRASHLGKFTCNLWHNGRRATQLCRFTLWHNGRRATQLGWAPDSVDLLCGTTAAETFETELNVLKHSANTD